MNEFSFAIRQLKKSPVFTAVAVLSIAIGIGANTAIFSLVNEFLLRTLPVKNPDELVLFRAIHGTQGRMSRRGEGPGSVDPATGRSAGTPLSLLIFERFRAHRGAVSDVFAFAPFSEVHVLVDGAPESAISAQYVSGNYYRALGVAASIGRTLTPEDDRPSAPAAAVISHRFWERRFDRDPSVLGTSVAINRIPATIVGVSAPGFDGTQQAGETADISVALSHHLQFQPNRAGRAEPWYWWVRVMARLAPGATPEQARAALEPVFREAALEGWLAAPAADRTGPQPDQPALAADPGGQGENDLRRQHARTLQILMGLVGLVLLAACANVANLLVARANTRRRELALRVALGASRVRILRQLLAESMAIAAAGAALGLVFAWWSRDLLLSLRPFGTAGVVLDLPLDSRVLGFTLAAAIVTAVVFGLLPALRASRVDLTAEFQGGSRTLGGGGRSRASQTLMTLQVAVSLVLLVSTGLFVRTLNRLQGVESGFNAANLVLFRVDATSAGYTPERVGGLHRRIHERLETIPGVQAATFSRVALLSRTRQTMSFSVPGRPAPQGAARVALTNGVAANFFSAMQLPIVLGRGFTDRDDAAAPTVAVVNQTLARQYFGDASPVGRRLAFTAPNFAREVEIVGVARDAKYTELRTDVPPTVYLPALQQPDGNANFAVRAAHDPAALFPAIQAAVGEIDPALPILNLRTQREQIDRLHGQERLFARLSGFFGLATLVLACVGLYGLMSSAVTRRASEIGLRIALGAVPGQMIRMVVGESLVLVGLGAAVGLAAAYPASRLVTGMLFEVSPADPIVYATVALTLMAAGVSAAAIPARRASRISPLRALSLD